MKEKIFQRTICVSLKDIDDGISPDVRCEEFMECITRNESEGENVQVKNVDGNSSHSNRD